jgi:hypothetical protein
MAKKRRAARAFRRWKSLLNVRTVVIKMLTMVGNDDS